MQAGQHTLLRLCGQLHSAMATLLLALHAIHKHPVCQLPHLLRRRLCRSAPLLPLLQSSLRGGSVRRNG